MSRIGTTLEQLRDRPDQELREALVETRDQLFRLELGKYTNQVTSSAELQNKRRDIARILTVLRGRELGLEVQAQKKAETPAAEAPAEETPGKKTRKTKKAKS
jgi:large subunit ribosomal protein L29